MASQSILAIAIATIIILTVQALVVFALAVHVMSRMSESAHTSEKHDAEDQESGPPQSVPYNATHTPPVTAKEVTEAPQTRVAEEDFDDTDSLYRMPTPPPKNARRNAVVSGMGDGSSSVYSQPEDPEPADANVGNEKVEGTEFAHAPGSSKRDGAESPESDYGPVTYRY